MTVSLFSNFALSSNTLPSVVSVNCDLVRGSETQVLNELLPLVKRESIALDLAGVERMDASGIATLITLYCTSIEAGTDFSIVAPSAHVSELLSIVGLHSILIAGERTPEYVRECQECPAA